ncbi:MAG: hypothetical protein WCP14_00135 [bacterium]
MTSSQDTSTPSNINVGPVHQHHSKEVPGLINASQNSKHNTITSIVVDEDTEAMAWARFLYSAYTKRKLRLAPNQARKEV